MRFVAQQFIMKPFMWAVTRPHIHGRRHLRTLKGPYILASNHTGHLDAPLLMSSLPRRLVRFLSAGAAADYFFNSKWKAALTTLFFNAFPVERSGTRTRKGLAGNLLSDGVPILLFPEGTRSRTGLMANFKPGFAALSISRGVPVLPAALVGVHEAMPPGLPLPQPGRPEVHIVFGAPMWPEDGETALRFANRVRETIVTLYDQTALATGFPRTVDYEQAVLEARAAEEDNPDGDDNPDTDKEQA